MFRDLSYNNFIGTIPENIQIPNLEGWLGGRLLGRYLSIHWHMIF